MSTIKENDDAPNIYPPCPKCSSTRTWKNGSKMLNRAQVFVQRYKCMSCKYIYYEHQAKIDFNVSDDYQSKVEAEFAVYGALPFRNPFMGYHKVRSNLPFSKFKKTFDRLVEDKSIIQTETGYDLAPVEVKRQWN